MSQKEPSVHSFKQKEPTKQIEPFNNAPSDLEDEDEQEDDILGDMPQMANFDKTRIRADSTQLNELDIDG